MKYHDLGEYDKELLKKAKHLIEEVYFYHYGDSYMRSQIKRLETIIKKIDKLLADSDNEND